MSHRTNPLNVEHLESRELMAGDINAVVTNGMLFLNEARFQSGQANHVAVHRLPSGLIRVEGLPDASGDRTLVNGAAFKDFWFGGNNGLVASLGSGDDVLSVACSGLASINVDMSRLGATDNDWVNILGGTQTHGPLRIVTGGGVDNVFIENTRVGDGFGFQSESLTIDTGAGMDVVTLTGGVLINDNATILTGQGDDMVLVRGTQIGNGLGSSTENMRIDTGAGADFVRFGGEGQEVRVKGNLLVATSFGFEVDVDTVRMSNTTAFKSLAVLTGSGDDKVAMDAVTATVMSLSMGDGNDTAALVDRVRAGGMFIGMGTGNDVLDLTGVGANFLSADGGAGVDRLNTFPPGAVGSSNVVNWEVINPVTPPPTFDPWTGTPGKVHPG